MPFTPGPTRRALRGPHRFPARPFTEAVSDDLFYPLTHRGHAGGLDLLRGNGGFDRDFDRGGRNPWTGATLQAIGPQHHHREQWEHSPLSQSGRSLEALHVITVAAVLRETPPWKALPATSRSRHPHSPSPYDDCRDPRTPFPPGHSTRPAAGRA